MAPARGTSGNLGPAMSTQIMRTRSEPRIPRVGAAHFYRARTFGGFSALTGSAFETRLPPHVHSNYVLGIVDAGAVRVTVRGRSLVAEPGMVILLPPFVVHTEIPVDDRGWSFRYLYPSEAAVREALGSSPDRRPALPLMCPVLRDPQIAAALIRVMEDLEGVQRMQEADDFVALVRQLRDRACAPPDRSIDATRREIRAVRGLITERPMRGVRLSDLAGAAGLSQFHFSRLFKAEVGLPPYAFFEQVRIAFAHDLIHQGLDLTTVAYQLGYADQSHLTRHFHRGSFTTPGQLALLTGAPRR
jgi:AraC-like DNA-binding protein